MTDAADPPGQPSKKKKKALAFLRPTLKPTPNFDSDSDSDFLEDGASKDKEKEAVEDDLDLFRRSKDFFSEVIKKENDASREATPERKHKTLKHTTEDSEDEVPTASSSFGSKKRKLSIAWVPESYNDLYGPPSPQRRSSRPLTQSSPALVAPIEQAAPSPATVKIKGKGKEEIELVQIDLLSTTPTPSKSHHRLSTDVVPLDDDEDFSKEAMLRDRAPTPRKVKRESPSTGMKAASPIVVEDSDDDLKIDTGPEPKEDPLAHFVHAARKRQAEAARLAAATAADFSPDDDAEPLSPRARQARSMKNAPFIAVKVFVASRIAAHAHPQYQIFGSKRKSTQSLGPVRQAFVQWLRKYGTNVSPEMEKDIFLTWRGRRLYTSVSIVGLGCDVQANGEIDMPDSTPGYIQGGVLLEGWTTEDFERHVAEEARQRLIYRGEAVEQGGEAGLDDEEGEEQEPQVAKIRVLFQEKDREPQRMTTYVDTPLKVLIGAYKRQQKVSDDQEVRLRFDGEWLDPSTTVEQADIDDLCTVEVYLK